MGIVNNALSGASGQSSGYNLTNSLRFRSSASANLSRTFSTPTDNKKWTWSGWVKRGELGTSQTILGGYSSGTGQFPLYFTSSNTLAFYDSDGVSTYYQIGTSAVFRDPSAWYHIVFVFDSANATQANRIIIYVNGVSQTLSSIGGSPGGLLPLNRPSYWNASSAANNIGCYIAPPPTAYNFLDGYLTEVNFVDGQALTPSSFGETSTSTGVWIPKKYTGTYGTNGFYLPFTNTASTSTLGNDFSGNGNNWTTNNISLTAGSTYDSMTDVPTLTSATAANYCVLSPVDTYDNPPTEGNLRRTGVGHTGSPWSTCRATLGVSSGKWYFEGTFTGSTGSVGNNMIGVMTTTTSTLSDAYGGSTTRSYQANGNLQGDNSTGTVSSATSGDVIMIAFDVDAGKLWVGKNGTWMNSGVPASGTGNVFTTLPTSPIVPQVSMYGNTGDNYGWFTNFGQRPFAYTPPTGFVALNTFNLPTPTIGATAATTANKYFDATLYTGNGSTNTIINAGGFQPDLVWIKSRNFASFHALADSVRGVSLLLNSNATSAESTQTNSVTSLNSNGFSLGADTSTWVNYNTSTLVAWQWRASNATAVTNTAGTITSTVSANTTAGFSIVTWTGTGSTATIGHGLGVAPKMIVWIHRTNAGAYNHITYHASLPSAAYVVYLNLAIAQSSDNNAFNSTAPTSSVFTVGGYNNVDSMVAYCFAEVAGYSAFGKYTGNGSTNGPFIYTGFRPAYVMIKRTDSANWWQIWDKARNPENVVNKYLAAQTSDAEYTASSPNDLIDFTANGFKIRGSNNAVNANGGTYIYMAFAENPFKYANAR